MSDKVAKFMRARHLSSRQTAGPQCMMGDAWLTCVTSKTLCHTVKTLHFQSECKDLDFICFILHYVTYCYVNLLSIIKQNKTFSNRKHIFCKN